MLFDVDCGVLRRIRRRSQLWTIATSAVHATSRERPCAGPPRAGDGHDAVAEGRQLAALQAEGPLTQKVLSLLIWNVKKNHRKNPVVATPPTRLSYPAATTKNRPFYCKKIYKKSLKNLWCKKKENKEYCFAIQHNPLNRIHFFKYINNKNAINQMRMVIFINLSL